LFLLKASFKTYQPQNVSTQITFKSIRKNLDVIKSLLSLKLGLSDTFLVADIKILNLPLSGGTNKGNHAIRNAFALLINQNELTSCIMLNFFEPERKYLADHLLNNTKIINSITYLQIDEEIKRLYVMNY
jgi:hypothetical protein